MKTYVLISFQLAAILSQAACATIESYGALKDARSTIARAQTALGEDAAPNQRHALALAEAYLSKALEEEGEANHEAARMLAEKSRAWAERAQGLGAAPADQTEQAKTQDPSESKAPNPMPAKDEPVAPVVPNTPAKTAEGES